MPDAEWYCEGEEWVAVTAAEDGGSVRHRFTGENGNLLEKRRLTQRGKVMGSVSYSDYDDIGPRHIVVQDNTQRYAYSLKLRVTAWRTAETE